MSTEPNEDTRPKCHGKKYAGMKWYEFHYRGEFHMRLRAPNLEEAVDLARIGAGEYITIINDVVLDRRELVEVRT